MSWDATLTDDRGHTEGDWNCTHNVAPMIYDAIERSSTIEPLTERESWYDRLNGMTGTDGRDYLTTIICALEADPARYEAMNPPNGWGSYDGLLGVLREMRDRVPDWPTVWSTSG